MSKGKIQHLSLSDNAIHRNFDDRRKFRAWIDQKKERAKVQPGALPKGTISARTLFEQINGGPTIRTSAGPAPGSNYGFSRDLKGVSPRIRPTPSKSSTSYGGDVDVSAYSRGSGEVRAYTRHRRGGK